MPMVRIQTVWSGVGGAPYYSNHYFTAQVGVGGPQDCQDAVSSFWDNMKHLFNSNLHWQLSTTQFTIDETTGLITTANTVTAKQGFGTATGDALPFQTQGLINWTTGVFLGGRQVRGRTFVPGPSETRNTVTGEPDATYITDTNSVAAQLVAAVPQLVVYTPTHHTYAVASAGANAGHWGVLRSRR